MKKLFPLLALVLMISLALPAYAAEAQDDTSTFTEAEKAAFDSVKLSEEEKSAYAASPEDTVIKIYALPGFLGGARSEDRIFNSMKRDYFRWKEGQEHLMKTFLSPLYVSYYMAVSPEGDVQYVPQRVGTPVEPSFQNHGDWTQLLPYVTDTSLLFGEEVEVYHVYCFSENYALDPLGYEELLNSRRCRSRGGMYVYYETERGSYVLYARGKDTYVAEGELSLYMFSAQDFFDYSSRLYAYYQEEKQQQDGIFAVSMKAFAPEYFGYLSHRLSDFSLTEKDAVYHSLKLTEEEKVIYSYSFRVYCNSGFFDGSLKKLTVEEIAAMEFWGRSGNNNRVTKMYVPFKNNEFQKYRILQTSCSVSKHGIVWQNHSDWSALMSYLIPPEIFGDSVKIEAVYCFTEDYRELYDEYGYDYGHGCAIYYVTSAGDFVLYTPNTNEENGPLGALYMFTAEEFFEYTSLLGDECARERREGKTEYTRSLPEAFGFASHLLADFTLPTEQAPAPPAPPAEPTPEPVSYVWIPVTAGVLVVLGGACAVFILRRKKN